MRDIGSLNIYPGTKGPFDDDTRKPQLERDSDTGFARDDFAKAAERERIETERREALDRRTTMVFLAN